MLGQTWRRASAFLCWKARLYCLITFCPAASSRALGEGKSCFATGGGGGGASCEVVFLSLISLTYFSASFARGPPPSPLNMKPFRAAPLADSGPRLGGALGRSSQPYQFPQPVHSYRRPLA